MKAVILLATLKKEEASNTEVLTEFFLSRLKKRNVTAEVIKLVHENILPGTLENMGEGDAWPTIQQKLIDADIIIFSTPVWWGVHSSEMQKVVERLDNIHDQILAGKTSPLQDKVGGIIITGDSDGAEQIIGVLSNFLNAIGIVVPPYATLSVLWDGHTKGKIRPKAELLKKYEADYAKTAEKMALQLVKYTKVEA